MKLSILSTLLLALLGLVRVATAADYTLDASTLGVGATAGENLVVKEGCLDPSKSCTEKIHWLTTSSPAKVGSLQISGNLSDNFEVVVTSDLQGAHKTISLLTSNNRGISLKFDSDGRSYGSLYEFSPDGIGKGGTRMSGAILPGWTGGYTFNEIRLVVQKGIANVYSNGQAINGAIELDVGTVFDRVIIQGLDTTDRLSEVKVRGIQGTTACTGTGTTPSTITKIDGISTNAFVSPTSKMTAGVLISGGTKRTMVRA